MSPTSMMPLTFEGHDLRLSGEPDAPEWIAQDVCDALEIAEAKSSLRDFDEDEKGVRTMHTLGGPQEMLTVTEPGLYRLILRSRSSKDFVVRFRRWVLHEVLPSIRKTGGYTADRHEARIRSLEAGQATLLETLKLQAQALAGRAPVQGHLFLDASPAAPRPSRKPQPPIVTDEALAKVFVLWRETYGDDACDLGDALLAAPPLLRNALRAVRPTARALSYVFRGVLGRPIGGLVLQSMQRLSHHRPRAWRVMPALPVAP